MRDIRALVGKITLVGVFVFVVYFVVFLILDMAVSLGAAQYDFLDPALYFSAIANALVSAILFLLIFFTLRTGKMMRVIALGMVFLAAPVRALLMLDFGTVLGISLNLIYNLAVISISAFLLYRFGREYDTKTIGLGFVSLFYLYVFVISIAVPVRDALVSAYMLVPISFGSYLHYGFYDYLTAFYAIVLGVLGLKLLWKELKEQFSGERELYRLNALVRAGRYKQAARLGEKIRTRASKEDREVVDTLTAYAYLRAGQPEKAYELLKGIDGAEGLKGDICVALKKLDEAKMHYKLAIDADSRDYASMVNLGRIYADEGNYREAESWWGRAMAINNKDPVVWQNLSALEVVRGRHDEALNIIKEAEKHVKA